MAFPRGKVFNGHTIPYGTFTGASVEVWDCYYRYNYKNDHDMPELPDHVEVVQVDGDPEEALYNKERNSLLHDVLDQLTPRQAKVLRFRCGIGVNSEYTLEEIGNILGVTRERVRQIEAKAMRRIKSPSFSFDLFRGIFYNEPWLWSEAKQKHDKEMAEAAKKRDLKKLRLSRN